MKLGAWLGARRAARILIMAGCFPLGLLGIVSMATAALSGIVQGWRSAMVDAAAAVALLLGLTLATGGDVQAVLLTGIASLGGAGWLGGLTGQVGSLTLPLQAVLLVVVGLTVGFYALSSDPVGYWETVLESFARDLAEVGVELADPAGLAPLAPLMPGLVGASTVATFSAALALGGFWASAAGGPAFGPMFRSLRLGYVVGGLTAACGVASLLGSASPAANLLVVLGLGFALQGLAVVHWQARAREWPWPVLLLVYVPLFFGMSAGAAVLLALAMLGFVDNWYGLRRGP